MKTSKKLSYQDLENLPQELDGIKPLLLSMPEDQRDHIYGVSDSNGLIMVGGIHACHPGTGACWVQVTDLGRKGANQALMVVKSAVNHMREISEAEGFRRLQATVELGNVKGERFLEVLGFQKEGVLRNYGVNGKNHSLWSKIYA